MRTYTIELTEDEREQLLLATLKYKNEEKAYIEKTEEFKNYNWAKDFYKQKVVSYNSLEEIYIKLIRAKLEN